MMKYQGALLAVKDVEVSKKFYADLFDQKVALDYGRNISFSGGFFIQQDFDWLTGIPKEQMLTRANNMELYFETDDLPGFVEKARAYGVEFVHDIRTYDWKQRGVRIYDPDLHIIEVSDTMEQVVRNYIADGYTAEETAKELQMEIDFVESCL